MLTFAAVSGNLHDAYKVFEAGFWCEIGHVRVAFGALDVESFFSAVQFLVELMLCLFELGVGMHFHCWKWH